MTELFLSNLPWFWVGILIICLVVEAFTMVLTTIWPAIASIPMIFISRTDLPFRWQLLIFVILTIALIIITRPIAIKKLKLGNEKTNADTILGKEVLIVKKLHLLKKEKQKDKTALCGQQKVLMIQKSKKIQFVLSKK
jgi:membrane protein implicated in regulation of membrane protease activity